MAKLNVCLRAIHIQSLVTNGKQAEARLEAARLLRVGYASAPFLALVADFVDPPKRGKGAPPRPPYHWIEIGELFAELESKGVSRVEAIAACCVDFDTSEGTVRRALDFYESARDEGNAD